MVRLEEAEAMVGLEDEEAMVGLEEAEAMVRLICDVNLLYISGWLSGK